MIVIPQGVKHKTQAYDDAAEEGVVTKAVKAVKEKLTGAAPAKPKRNPSAKRP